jgi:barstar (barnase inhibitor)
VGAPAWHGRNFNALNDSICTARINRIETPYRLVIQNFGLLQEDARKMTDDLIDFINELNARGRNVEIRVENGK